MSSEKLGGLGPLGPPVPTPLLRIVSIVLKTTHLIGSFPPALECQHYQSIRYNTHNILKKIFQMNIQTEFKRNLMNNVISTDDPVVIELFSTFIFKCFTLRDRNLQAGNIQ